MDMQSIQNVAQAFVNARATRLAINEFPGNPPESLEDAYAIQNAALKLADRGIAGWKVGRINSPDDIRLGANRLVGPVFKGTERYCHGDPIEMRAFAAGFIAVEAEFMLKIADRIPPTLDDNASVHDFIDEIRIGIEVASSPFKGINDGGPCVTISDHGNNAGIALGRVVEPELWGSLDDISVTTLIDGKTVGTATTRTMLDGPFGAAKFLINNLRSRDLAPRAGQWISSGAITGVHQIRVGSTACCKFDGIGSISVSITGGVIDVSADYAEQDAEPNSLQ